MGGESGWGVIGETIERALTTVAALLDANLVKLGNEIEKDKLKNSVSVSSNSSANSN